MTTQTKNNHRCRTGLICPVFTILIACWGCQTRSARPNRPALDPQRRVLIVDSTGTRTTVQADWDDLDAALDVGFSAIEAALLQKDQPQPGLVVCSLVTILDDEGVVEFQQLDPPPSAPSPDAARDPSPTGPVTIQIRASIGRFGEQHQSERTLVQTIRRRLIQLRGKDAAPVR